MMLLSVAIQYESEAFLREIIKKFSYQKGVTIIHNGSDFEITNDSEFVDFESYCYTRALHKRGYVRQEQVKV